MADGRRRNADGTTSTLVNGKWVVNGKNGKPAVAAAKPKPTATAGANPFFQNPGNEFVKSMGNITKNPQGQIAGQIEANQYVAEQNANLNRPNVNNQYGSESWVQQPDGSFSRNYKESQNQEGIRNLGETGDIQTGQTMNGLGRMAAGNLGQAYSLAGAPQVPGMGDRIGERQRIENGLIGRFNETMNPEYDRQNANLRQQLADEGHAPGSKGYDIRMKQLTDRQDNDRRDYNVSALQLGGTEMQRTNDLAVGDYDRYGARYDKERYAPVNEMQALGQANQYRPREQGHEFSPMAAVDFGGVDVGGAVGQFQNYDIAQKGLRKVGGGGRSGGDGSGSLDPFFPQFNSQIPQTTYQPSATSNIISGVGNGIGAGLTMAGMNARKSNVFMRNPG